MIIVKKLNKEITIHEEQKDSYLALGYSAIDEKGNIVEAGNATEYADLKALNDSLKSENEKLSANIKKLENENKKLKSNENKE